MVARPAGAGRLNGVAALLIFLQVEAVVEAGIDVLEVGIRGHAKSTVVAASCLWNVRTAWIRVLPHAAGVLVNEGNRIVVAAGVPTAAELNALDPIPRK